MVSLSHNQAEIAARLSSFDSEHAPLVQPCFLEEGFIPFAAITGITSIAVSYNDSPVCLSPSVVSLSRSLWEMHRRLDGHRSLIIIPMGGAIPGSIPVMVAYEYLALEGYSKDDSDYAILIWEEMDRIVGEQRK